MPDVDVACVTSPATTACALVLEILNDQPESIELLIVSFLDNIVALKPGTANATEKPSFTT